jgi:hypothetical protein
MAVALSRTILNSNREIVAKPLKFREMRPVNFDSCPLLAAGRITVFLRSRRRRSDLQPSACLADGRRSLARPASEDGFGQPPIVAA